MSLSLSPDPLRVTLSPKNLKTGISSTVILSCAVQGSPQFTVAWFRNTEPVAPDQHFSIQGVHNETLFITAAQKRHSGAYQCFATRKGQTAQDFSIILLEGEQGLQQRAFISGDGRTLYRGNAGEGFLKVEEKGPLYVLGDGP